jgi:hypothetical protein
MALKPFLNAEYATRNKKLKNSFKTIFIKP